MEIVLVLLGVVSGVISGMGIGGGTVLIPAMIFFLGINQQTAQNINLLYFIPTAIVALITHIKNRNIEKKVVFPLSVFGIIGAIGGSLIAINIDSGILKKMFGGFLLVMGIFEFFKKNDKEKTDLSDSTNSGLKT